MKKYFFSICAFALFYSTSFAQYVVPNQKLVVPTDVSAGELVTVSVSPISEAPKYLKKTQYKWLISENGKEKTNMLVWPDNQKVFFGVGIPKKDTTYNVILMIGYQYVKYDNDDEKTGKIVDVSQNISLLTGSFTVKGTTPAPPVPDPDTPPAFPTGKYDLSNKGYGWAMTKVGAADRKAATALATSLTTLASNTTITSTDDFLAKAKLANNAAITAAGSTPLAWDAFFLSFQDYTYNQYTQQKMTTLADFRTAWQELAVGLGKVK